MKKYIVLFLFFGLMPTFSWAAVDSCSDETKKLYTIDKRCYVTDEQKKEKPYNATVKVEAKETMLNIIYTSYCTGVVVKSSENILYVYTAKHCVQKEAGGLIPEIEITTPNGQVIKQLTLVAQGVGDSPMADYVIYKVPEKYEISSVNIAHKDMTKNTSYSVKSIGYGALKIMSNKDIERFQNKYIKYLKDEKNIESDKKEEAYGWIKGGIDVLENAYAKNFVNHLKQKEANYYKGIFKDDKWLKVSKCESNPLKQDATTCQSYNGNSGGGVFDEEDNVVALLVKGLVIIGGTKHAHTTTVIWNVPEFKENIKKDQK